MSILQKALVAPTKPGSMMAGAENCIACHEALPHSRREHADYIRQAGPRGEWERVPLKPERRPRIGRWLLAAVAGALLLVIGTYIEVAIAAQLFCGVLSCVAGAARAYWAGLAVIGFSAVVIAFTFDRE